MKAVPKNLEVVLVRAENPVNIGQTARAMKNFGVSRLRLVQCADALCEQAMTPGWKARAILKKASLHSALDTALAKASYSVGFTTRAGKDRGNVRLFPAMVPEILGLMKTQKVQFVYGNEKNGLSNEELKKCTVAAAIPANPDYSSLNLAHAAAVSLSMIYMASLGPLPAAAGKPESFYPKPGEVEAFLKDLKKALQLLGYEKDGENNLLPRIYEDFKNFFRHSGMDKKEMHLFHSLISRTNQRVKKS